MERWELYWEIARNLVISRGQKLILGLALIVLNLVNQGQQD